MAIPGSEEWLASVIEDIVDPDRPIIDTHHHLWKTASLWGTYELTDLWADTGSGHNVEKTVFIDCRSEYRTRGPSHLKPVGETEYVVKAAADSRKDANRATIAGIVAHADMTLGPLVEEVLVAHEQAGEGLFRGIRHAGPSDDTGTLTNAGGRRTCPYGREDFREGVRTLGRMGYSYDTWHFFHQNQDYLALARAVPDTTMILDHFGTPLGVGAYAGRADEIFEIWKKDITEIAACPNVHAKLGGLAMPDNGFGWDRNDHPPSSDEFQEAQRRYYLHAIECFGPDRCMFESNFPVDRLSISYQVLWNGMKKIVADFSDDEKHALFYGTASRIYRV
ncbi:MAG: amidohydrolase family protein [Pseudomonadota bacterium]|nr:amidohydrolase family protein [Pseudomonadota bacterium]